MLTPQDVQALALAIQGIGRAGGAPAPMNRQYSVTGGGKEVIFQPIYDRVNIAAAVPAAVSLFSGQVGSSATLIRAGATATVNKTLRDTNMRTAGVLQDRSFDVRALQFILIPLQHAAAGAATNDISDDKATLYEAGWFELKPSSKTRLEMSLLPFKYLDPDFPATTAGTTTMSSAAGVGGMMLSLGEDAILIEKGVPFTFTVSFDGAPSLVQTFDLQVYLWSYNERPVQ